MTVPYPPSNLRRLELSVSHEDHGARKMAWDLKAGEQVPSTYTFKLEGDTLWLTQQRDLRGPVANPATFKLIRVE